LSSPFAPSQVKESAFSQDDIFQQLFRPQQAPPLLSLLQNSISIISWTYNNCYDFHIVYFNLTLSTGQKYQLADQQSNLIPVNNNYLGSLKHEGVF